MNSTVLRPAAVTGVNQQPRLLPRHNHLLLAQLMQHQQLGGFGLETCPCEQLTMPLQRSQHALSGPWLIATQTMLPSSIGPGGISDDSAAYC
jgi:hypothetical protein